MAPAILTTLGVGTESSTQLVSAEEALQITRSLYILLEKEMSLLEGFPEKNHLGAFRVDRN